MQAWRTQRCVPALPPDEDELLHARRLVAQRCLYGVDVNPRAVELVQLSLWLATLAKAHPFTFLDHALKCGDSLLGVRELKELEWFYVDSVSGQQRLAQDQNWLQTASAKRRQLEELPENDSRDVEHKRALLEEIEVLMWQERLLADVVTGTNEAESRNMSGTVVAICRTRIQTLLHHCRNGAGVSYSPCFQIHDYSLGTKSFCVFTCPGHYCLRKRLCLCDCTEYISRAMGKSTGFNFRKSDALHSFRLL